ncbi:hypothetical protein ACFCXS_00790 [Streptomyces sp. NPDC056373]|uniref:hypothetical protein n=1 Tax=Streptomyces sp. NPDC056373 TaxID=3345798 RepID=UPI0035E225F0
MDTVHHPTSSAEAWEHSATQSAWKKLFTSAVAGQVLWPAVCVGAFVLMILAGRWSMWVMLPVAVYALYRSFLQRQYLVAAAQTRRLLKVYPWRSHKTPASGIGQIPGAKLGDVWLAFPNPDQSDDVVHVILHGHARSAWWRRRLGRGYGSEQTAQVAEIWFAGDPRFAGVIAVPGPKRLFLLYQLADSHASTDEWVASPEALELARRAGVRVPS